MAPRPAFITKRDAETVFAAARAHGYDTARMISHPDGRREIVVEKRGKRTEDDGASEWDRLLDDAEG